MCILQPHEVSPEYLKGRAARNAAVTTEKNSKAVSKDTKNKSTGISVADVTKVSYHLKTFIWYTNRRVLLSTTSVIDHLCLPNFS